MICETSHAILFFAASYVFIRRDVGGVITSILRATNVIVYFLSNQNASISVTIELICNEYFSGEIKVGFNFF